MSITLTKRLFRYLGTALLLIFLASWPLSYAYYRWDDQRVIRAYGGDPTASRNAVAFLGEYLENHLAPGMTRDEVHGVIHSYRKSWVYKQSDASV